MDIDHDDHHMQIADSFLVSALDIPSSSITYNLDNVLSNSQSQFTCDLTVAIESIPNLESMNTGVIDGNNDYDEPTTSGCSTSVGTKRIRDLVSETSCSSTSSETSSEYCDKIVPRKHDDGQRGKDYDSSGLQVTVTSTVTIGRKNKRRVARVRKRKMIGVNRVYVCDWCYGRATFKSCQGLRFHKTLRCPERERKLGK